MPQIIITIILIIKANLIWMYTKYCTYTYIIEKSKYNTISEIKALEKHQQITVGKSHLIKFSMHPPFPFPFPFLHHSLGGTQGASP